MSEEPAEEISVPEVVKNVVEAVANNDGNVVEAIADIASDIDEEVTETIVEDAAEEFVTDSGIVIPSLELYDATAPVDNVAETMSEELAEEISVSEVVENVVEAVTNSDGNIVEKIVDVAADIVEDVVDTAPVLDGEPSFADDQFVPDPAIVIPTLELYDATSPAADAAEEVVFVEKEISAEPVVLATEPEAESAPEISPIVLDNVSSDEIVIPALETDVVVESTPKVHTPDDIVPIWDVIGDADYESTASREDIEYAYNAVITNSELFGLDRDAVEDVIEISATETVPTAQAVEQSTVVAPVASAVEPTVIVETVEEGKLMPKNTNDPAEIVAAGIVSDSHTAANPYGIKIPTADRIQTEELRNATMASRTPFRSGQTKDSYRDALWLMSFNGIANIDDELIDFVDMGMPDNTPNSLMDPIDMNRDPDNYANSGLAPIGADAFSPDLVDESGLLTDSAEKSAPDPERRVTIDELLAGPKATRPAENKPEEYDEVPLVITADDYRRANTPAPAPAAKPVIDVTSLAQEYARATSAPAPAPAPMIAVPAQFNMNGVSVDDPNGLLAGCKMSVSPIDIGDTINVDGEEMDVLNAYNISFAGADGASPEYDGEGSFEVKLPVPFGEDASNISAVYYDELEGANHEKLETEVAYGASGNPEFIKFKTNHFSIFALARSKSPAPIDTDDSDESQVEITSEDASVDASSDDEGTMLVGGELIPVHYRSSYMSRLIQSDEQLKEYYAVIKNALLSFVGVKSRISWNGESFNRGRTNCAKVNVKGRSLIVCLALNPADYEGTKYYFKDVSDKPKYDKVPMLIKIRSDRSLKYALELIEDMMAQLGIDFESEQLVDYVMPYESTEALIARDLIKVILPSGVTFDTSANVVKMDVAKLIEDSKDDSDEVEEPVVEEAAEPAPEQTLEPETVEQIPESEEQPAEAEEEHEEFVHADATLADELVTDDEAIAQIEIIDSPANVRDGKLAAINLDTICESFSDGDTVTLEELKARRLIPQSSGRVKILSRGIMTKRLTIIADKFSLQAVKMITLAGGHAEQFK